MNIIIHLFVIINQTLLLLDFFFFSSRRRHTRFDCDWSSDVCSSDLDRHLAEKTLALIPENIPVARIDLNGDYIETALGALVMSLHVAGWAGAARDIDPDRKSVV